MIEEGEALRYAFPATSGSDFALRWTHSVEKEDWEERFQIQTNGSLMLVETRFKTFGAGVPAAVGRETRLEQGWVVMSGRAEGGDENGDWMLGMKAEILGWE